MQTFFFYIFVMHYILTHIIIHSPQGWKHKNQPAGRGKNKKYILKKGGEKAMVWIVGILFNL